jgi:hypothetical protein
MPASRRAMPSGWPEAGEAIQGKHVSMVRFGTGRNFNR